MSYWNILFNRREGLFWNELQNKKNDSEHDFFFFFFCRGNSGRKKQHEELIDDDNLYQIGLTIFSNLNQQTSQQTKPFFANPTNRTQGFFNIFVSFCKKKKSFSRIIDPFYPFSVVPCLAIKSNMLYIKVLGTTLRDA